MRWCDASSAARWCDGGVWHGDGDPSICGRLQGVPLHSEQPVSGLSLLAGGWAGADGIRAGQADATRTVTATAAASTAAATLSAATIATSASSIASAAIATTTISASTVPVAALSTSAPTASATRPDACALE